MLEIFQTPVLKYMNVRRQFLQKYAHPKSWGTYGSKQQVIALTALLDYFRETVKLAQLYPELENDIHVDNRKLVMKRIVQLPRKLHEEMIEELIMHARKEHGGSWRDQPILVTLQKIEAFLIMKQESCLMAYEDSVVDKVNNYESYMKKKFFDKRKTKVFNKSKDRTLLRKVRHGIYEKMRAKESVSDEMEEYRAKVDKFVKSEAEDDDLTEDEILAWKRRVKRTRIAVDKHEKYLERLKSESETDTDESEESEVNASEVDDDDSRVIDLEVDNVDSEASSLVDSYADEESEAEVTLFDSNTKSELKVQEELVSKLPDVPLDMPEDIVNVTNAEDVDDDIEKRLNKLKLFNQTLAKLEVDAEAEALRSEPVDMCSQQDEKLKEPERNSDAYEKELDLIGMKDDYIQIRTEETLENENFKQVFSTTQEIPELLCPNCSQSKRRFEFKDPGDQSNPSMLSYIQASFVMIVAACKTLDEKLELLSAFVSLSNPPTPSLLKLTCSNVGIPVTPVPVPLHSEFPYPGKCGFLVRRRGK